MISFFFLTLLFTSTWKIVKLSHTRYAVIRFGSDTLDQKNIYIQCTFMMNTQQMSYIKTNTLFFCFLIKSFKQTWIDTLVLYRNLYDCYKGRSAYCYQLQLYSKKRILVNVTRLVSNMKCIEIKKYLIFHLSLLWRISSLNVHF